MKTTIFGILALFALAPAAFAQTWCEQSCCEENGGSWDSDYEYCSGADSNYYTCMDDYCSTSSYETGTGSSSNVSCCGSGFILAAVGGVAFLGMGRKAE
ncbi:hypothetical protein L0Y65_06050 [Candidatus Micrarchaeota archaeon]|nr:hypothetical protein [Candidatus Micrarchaeota archaeon]